MYLQFHSKGKIEVVQFDGPKVLQGSWEYEYEHVLPAYRRQALAKKPVWERSCSYVDAVDGHCAEVGSKPVMLMSQKVRICLATRCGKRTFIFVVAHDDSATWTVPGGGVVQGQNGDRDWLGTAEREWNEELPGHSWMSSADAAHNLIFPISKGHSKAYGNPCNFSYPELFQDVGIECTAWIFVQAAETFFCQTEWYNVGGRLLNIEPPPGVAVVTSQSPQEDFRLMHTDGALFLEHTVGTWVEVCRETGELLAPFSGLIARADLRSIFTARPSEVWGFLGSLLNGGYCPPAYKHSLEASAMGFGLGKLRFYERKHPHQQPPQTCWLTLSNLEKHFTPNLFSIASIIRPTLYTFTSKKICCCSGHL